MTLRKVALPLFVVSLLAGCASNGASYPSLNIGDRTRPGGTMQPAPAEPAPPPLPASPRGDIPALLDEARSAHRAFLEEAKSATAIVGSARGTSEGNDSWARAQIAIGSLESARSRTMIPFAELDRMAIDAQLNLEQDEVLASARSEVEALVESENSAIGSLLSELR